MNSGLVPLVPWGTTRGNREEVKTIHNEKALTFHEAIGSRVKDAGNSGAVTRISGDPSWNETLEKYMEWAAVDTLVK